MATRAVVSLDGVKVETLILPVSEIYTDLRLQYRQDVDPKTGVDPVKVAEYAEAIQLGATWEAITVGYWLGRNYVVNGFHSLAAHKAAGKKEILCKVYRVPQRDQLKLLAAMGNLEKDRQKPLTMDCKKEYLKQMRQEGMPWHSLSLTQIAKAHLGVSVDTVSRWIREMEEAGVVPVVNAVVSKTGVTIQKGQIGQAPKKKWENERSTLQAAQGEVMERLAEKKRDLEAADRQAREAREKLILAKIELEKAQKKAEDLGQDKINQMVAYAQIYEPEELNSPHPPTPYPLAGEGEEDRDPTPSPYLLAGEGNENGRGNAESLPETVGNYPMSDSGELMYGGKYVMYLRVDSFGVEVTAGAMTSQLERKPMPSELARLLGDWLDSLEVKPSKVEPKRVIAKVDYAALGGGESAEGVDGGYGYEADQDESEEVG